MLSKKTKDPRVTVFVAAFNAEQFIFYTVESVLNQSYTDFELLIIDDGSTDATLQIIRSFNDPRIRIECNDSNRGRPYTRNRGIELARGEYFAVLDADDLCEPNRLERQILFLEDNKDIAAVGSWAHFIDEKGALAFTCEVPTNNVEIHRKIFEANCFIHSSVTFRRQALQDAGGYSLAFPQAQDYELFLRLSANYNLANLPEALVRYRVHPGQVSLSKLSSQRRLADLARTSAFHFQQQRNLLVDGTIQPSLSILKKLKGDTGTIGNDYLNWSRTYRLFGREDLRSKLTLRALVNAPLSSASWNEAIALLSDRLAVPFILNIAKWYWNRLRSLMPWRR